MGRYGQAVGRYGQAIELPPPAAPLGPASPILVRIRVRVRVGLGLEERGMDSAVATLDNKACEGRVWQRSLHHIPQHNPSS